VDLGSVITSTVLQVSADAPDRVSKLPLLPYVVSRVHASRTRRGTGVHKRALHPSAFVVATSEEGQDGDDRDNV